MTQKEFRSRKVALRFSRLYSTLVFYLILSFKSWIVILKILRYSPAKQKKLHENLLVKVQILATRMISCYMYSHVFISVRWMFVASCSYQYLSRQFLSIFMKALWNKFVRHKIDLILNWNHKFSFSMFWQPFIILAFRNLSNLCS